MATTGTLDLRIWRNDDVYEYPLRVIGPNLTGAAMRAQVRLYRDAPGAAPEQMRSRRAIDVALDRRIIHLRVDFGDGAHAIPAPHIGQFVATPHQVADRDLSRRDISPVLCQQVHVGGGASAAAATTARRRSAARRRYVDIAEIVAVRVGRAIVRCRHDGGRGIGRAGVGQRPVIEIDVISRAERQAGDRPRRPVAMTELAIVPGVRRHRDLAAAAVVRTHQQIGRTQDVRGADRGRGFVRRRQCAGRDRTKD